MAKKMAEINPVTYKYIRFDPDIARAKAICFEAACISFMSIDEFTRNEYTSRKDLIDSLKMWQRSDFGGLDGQTYWEMERVLPAEVAKQWSLLKLYLSNSVWQNEDQFTYLNEKCYVWEEV